MNHCPNCGTKIRPLSSGHGCGGMGSRDGCPKCGAVYEQTTGGIVPTYGGEQHRRVEYTTFKEELYRLSKEESHVFQIDWRNSEHNGEWAWSEPGFGDTHYHKTEDEAKQALAAFQKKLYDDLPWPNCDKCGKKAPREYGHRYQCDDCGRFCHLLDGKPGEWYSRRGGGRGEEEKRKEGA